MAIDDLYGNLLGGLGPMSKNIELALVNMNLEDDQKIKIIALLNTAYELGAGRCSKLEQKEMDDRINLMINYIDGTHDILKDDIR